MIHSMTGYGRAVGRVMGREVTVELRAVNNRFRDIAVRSPRRYAGLEEPVKRIIGRRIGRGRVDVLLQIDEAEARLHNMKLDLEMARAYYDILFRLKEHLSLPGEVTISHLIEFRDIITQEEEELDLEAFTSELEPLLDQALDEMIRMRQSEGAAIEADFAERLTAMREWVKEIESRRQVVLEEIRIKLEARVKALLADLEVDRGRLLQEVAYLADRSDITEELVRLESHLDQFLENMNAQGPLGRRLEFLLQEINREVNTIGSKSTDVTVTGRVLDLKTELEKLREQVQNVE